MTIWNLGMELIKSQGTTEQQARSFIGKMIKTHGEHKTAHAITDCLLKKPAEVKSFMIGCLKGNGEMDDDQLIQACIEKGIVTKGRTRYELQQRLRDK